MVAESVNGKLIRGWPIRSKMAAFGWKKRRFAVVRQSGFSMADGEVYKEDDMVNGSKKGNQRKWTFAEVVTEKHFRDKDEVLKVPKEGLSMSWDMVDKEELWLSRCTIGVLKKFSEVANMNSRLLSKGFSFQSNYLGDKYIIWCFNSVQEKDRFVSERSLWEDFFVSMNEWSDKFIPKSKLVWIRCWEVPLSCWNTGFFMKLGRQLGEPVCVEESTQNRARLDRGMVLVLVPHVWLCPGQIKVEMGGKCFVVKIVEEQFSLESCWQEELLRIIPVGGFPVDGGNGVEYYEVERKLSDDGDKATQKDSRAVVSARMSVNPIPTKLHFEYLADLNDNRGVGVNSKWSGSLGRKGSKSDKPFEVNLGLVRGKGPSVEKVPIIESSSDGVGCVHIGAKDALNGTPGLLQADRYVPFSDSKAPLDKRRGRYRKVSIDEISSKVLRGRGDSVLLKKNNRIPRSSNVGTNSKNQNLEVTKLEDEVAKVLEKGLALGLNFNGRKEELLDIIAKRDEVNDNRFRDLVRRLVLNYKAKGC